jgi:hypothetical protein
MLSYYFCILLIRVANPHHFNAIRIQISHLNLMGIPMQILLLIKVKRMCDLETLNGFILNLHASIVSVTAHSPPRLHYETQRLLNFDINADPDPSFHFNADPDRQSCC